MDMPVNQFKRALRDHRTIYGTWLMSAAPSTAEALGCAGLDFLVVDMEHVPVDTPLMIELLRTVAGTPAAAVVRLPWNDMVMVKRALDGGAQNVMLPFVQDADEARRAVAYTRYPPDGIRGVAGVHRASRYGTVTNYLAGAADEICVIVQIETLAALERLPEIAAVPGVDSIFIGPSDLAASMGMLGDLNHAAVQDKLRDGAQLCRKLGKPVGIVGPNPDMVGKFLEYGYTWVAIATDMSLMVGRAQEWLRKVKRQTPAAAEKPQGAY
jgi:2-dehydro-3-deoxyglucarate aldolase/4-hydroxy-2-oxoheptanedioate aldolase